MFRRIEAIVLGVFLVLATFLGCSAPTYNADKTQTCSDGTLSGDETDVDCGGSCSPCSVSKNCKKDTDCASSTCIGDRCYDASCRDGHKNNTESDIDCGGDVCPACKAGSKCARVSDCVAGQACVGNVCFDSACQNGKKDGTETDVDCGGDHCPACAVTKGCKISTDCTTGNACLNNICYVASCNNGKLEGTETDIDCGGNACPACKAGGKCAQTSDCVSGAACINFACFDAACQNGKQDGTESDIDCGGARCPACVIGKSCQESTDCTLGNACVGLVCRIATCHNGVLDGNETDTDCGGSDCPACDVSKKCLQNTDCSTGNVCIGGTCYIGSCQDSRINNSETDIDCGGTQCPVCDKGKTCNQPSDCVSNVPCTKNKCGDPQCFNAKQDGTETDVDCGGSCSACILDKACKIAADCESLNCQSGTCAAANCHDSSQNGGESAVDCGDVAGICPRCGTAMTCADSISCASNHCVTGVCAASTCTDQIVNGSETDKDCGGSCNPCADNLACSAASDCTSKVCQGGKCQAAGCADGVRNGQETGKDCGGPCAPPQKCPNGEGCSANSDCQFNTCSAGVCQLPACSNGKLDSTETDVDCGGSCSPCADGLKCADTTTGQDCQSKVCNSSTKTCDKPSCTDSVQNGNETDINCGGVTCTQRCLNGKKCLSDSDCQSKVCDTATNTCSVPTCSDGVQNGTETGQDCGGSCALVSPVKTCGTGMSCGVDGDCASNNCCTASTCKTLNVCSPPSCQDGKKNQGESGIDCGGDPKTTGCSTRCGPGGICQYPSDCDSGVCTNLVCQPPTCIDTVQNGNEMGADCGGNCAKGCPAGNPCKGPGDCDSSVCQKDSVTGAYTTCAAASCTDGVKNGAETFMDCGGGCKGCAQGQPCKVQTDCDLTIANIDCINNICAKPQCNDQVQDGIETDVDCGGGTCKKCADNLKCAAATDCTSSHCAADGTGTLRCAPPTCSDGVVNQGESGTDCGGTSSCARCGTGLGCTVPTDCLNGVCGSSNTCSASTCVDTVQNEQETDVDCGGPNCSSSTTACPNGKICKTGTDCLEFWCVVTSGTTGICTHPTCSDTVQNGAESDVDCGGTCPAKCADTKKCTKDLDCTNGWCNGGKCATPQCNDSTKNGTETGTDCGGKCAQSCTSKLDASCLQCANTSGCTTNLDCKSLNCSSNACAAPTSCIAKELNSQGPSGCGLCVNINSSDVPLCKAYLLCYFLHICNPVTGKDSTGADCVGNTGVCGINAIGGGNAPRDAAVASFTCACPSGL